MFFCARFEAEEEKSREPVDIIPSDPFPFEINEIPKTFDRGQKHDHVAIIIVSYPIGRAAVNATLG